MNDVAPRIRNAVTFKTEKASAVGSRGMAVSNHPLASAAGAEILAAGGNAIDAAVATQFTLTVVEPMMIGLIGGGTAHIRTTDGKHVIIDGMSAVPLAGRPDMYRPVPDGAPENYETVDRANVLGPSSVAAPGSLLAWCLALEKFGTMALADVMEPAIRHASRGFAVTPYLHDCIVTAAPDLALDKLISDRLMPGGMPLKAGERLVQGDYADALRLISAEGAKALHGGALGDALAAHMEKNGGYVSQKDLTGYAPRLREPIRMNYRGWEVVMPPPPAASGIHVAQMLAILEGFDLRGLGFGTVDTCHLIAEALRIAFADRAAGTGDPDFLDVPVAQITSREYAARRRAEIDMMHSKKWAAGVTPGEGKNTTHLTTADAHGNVVASTQTINNLFGARYIVPGTGMIPNNYMHTFDPRPGVALSIAPGKRVTTSMSPTMGVKDGKVRFALGLPGGKKIFPSAMQAIINLVDHGMSLQEAVEAPRIWTEGVALEVERGIPEDVRDGLTQRGHDVAVVPTVAGGMNGIGFNDDGSMTGAACWRADGTPVGVSGGLARAGVRFVLESAKPKA
jgi:gamma-glutamyltranspeptidase/glutathione hydrolase